MLAVSGCRLSLPSMPRITLVEMLLSSATRMRKSLGTFSAVLTRVGVNSGELLPPRWDSSSARVVLSV
ncbi:hypothetical protein D3C71_1478380 [compost metagenome]